MQHTHSPPNPPRVGRPRRGTEVARADTLIASATAVFLRDGYEATSIDKVAAEAGVSTRTIYERFRNKAELLGAVITRLVDRDLDALSAPSGLEHLDLRQGLFTVGKTLTGRASNPDSAALIRILAKEAQRFPEIAARMRGGAKLRVESAIADYLRAQVERGALVLTEPEHAAELFLHMVFAPLQECLLFGPSEEIAGLDFDAHLNRVIELFLCGALPRAAATDGNP